MRRLALLLPFLLLGCETLDGTVIRQASYLDNCPPERIRVVGYNQQLNVADAEVCGAHRRYQDIATHHGSDLAQRWQEVPVQSTQ